jgi:hypothetical protein
MEKFSFVIKGKTFQTDPLTVGNIIDLWKLKSVLSSGTYGQLYRMGLETADEALTAIDIESFLTVFCPDFIKQLKPGSVRDMGVEDYLELRSVYLNEIEPWLKKVEELLKKKSDNA